MKFYNLVLWSQQNWGKFKASFHVHYANAAEYQQLLGANCHQFMATSTWQDPSHVLIWPEVGLVNRSAIEISEYIRSYMSPSKCSTLHFGWSNPIWPGQIHIWIAKMIVNPTKFTVEWPFKGWPNGCAPLPQWASATVLQKCDRFCRRQVGRVALQWFQDTLTIIGLCDSSYSPWNSSL